MSVLSHFSYLWMGVLLSVLGVLLYALHTNTLTSDLMFTVTLISTVISFLFIAALVDKVVVEECIKEGREKEDDPTN